MKPTKWLIFFTILSVLPALFVLSNGDESADKAVVLDQELKPETVASKTDDQVVEREEDTISGEGFSVHDQKLLRERAETHAFQAEVNSLMKIIINSLYSNKEVFLREVISNASDALDKIRFLSLTNRAQLDTGSDLSIKIKVDPKTRTLHIIDTGIGMTRDELLTNLGTIAKSGTAAFLEAHKAGVAKDNSLIGQFGVGFYSVFLVADSVTVASKSNESEKQYVWQSDSKGTFSISEDPRGNTLGRGTHITLHLKEEDAEEFLDHNKLKLLAKKYSEFITFPIYLWASHNEENEVPLTEEEIKAQEEKEKAEKAENEQEEVEVDAEDKEPETEPQEEKPKTKKVTEVVWDWELVNETKPLWTRNPKEIEDDEYKSFYKAFTKDWQEPAKWQHFLAEGDVEFKSLLFVPSSAPNNLFDPNNEEARKGIKLYVKRVFITDDFKDLLPKYLNFIRGLIDSDDLPLNVSREMLQEHKILKTIKKKLVRKAIAMIQEMATGKKEEEGDESGEDAKDSGISEEYKKFWKNFGLNIKLGIIEDQPNKTRLSKLLLFHSSKTGDLTSLSDYVSRMREGQTQIYFLAGSSKEAVETSPLIEKLVKKGYEVLYMTDPIDEYTMTSLEKFDGKYKLTNIGKEGLKFDGEKDDEQKEKEEKQKFTDLTDFLKKVLSDRIDKAVISKRLTSSPSALVSSTYGWTANMERIIKAQALAGDMKSQAMYQPKKILEINPNHPIIIELLRRVESDPEDQTAKDVAELMYETACLTSGYEVEEPADFAGRINRMINLNLGLDPNAAPEEEPEPVAETQSEESTQEQKDEL